MENDYTIEKRDNCILLFGEIPMHTLTTLMSKQPKGSIIDHTLGRIAGAQFAFGRASDTLKLREKLSEEAIASTREIYRNTALGEGAIRWLAVGEQGSSSQAMFTHLTGVAPVGMSVDRRTAHPSDPGDLSRCIKLYEEVPEIRESMGKLKNLSVVWGNIADHWDVLVKMYHSGDDELYKQMKMLGC
jgi:hypothetical protein